MCAMTSHSQSVLRQPRCSSIRATAAASIPSGICSAMLGVLQADAYAGFNRLYEAGRKPGPITVASCWAHADASSSCSPM
jgi:hypothetical protein